MKLLRRLRAHPAVRYPLIALTLVVAILAAAIVSSLTIDLGPGLRGLAERQGSKQIHRPLHIGRLSIHLIRGRVVVDDLKIEGLKPTDRPFFVAKRISVGLDWSTLVQREVTISSVEMTDWSMIVEKWEDHHNFPKFGNDEEEKPKGSKRITTTLKYLHASRGRFEYDDHEKPWSIVGPNLNIDITNIPSYNGRAAFTDGLVRIQDNVPMWVNFRARFKIDGSHVRLDRIDLDSDGATSFATGDVYLDRWPEQTYQVKSHVNFPRMREIFFTNETWRVTGDGDFTGAFHLFKGGHDLHGAFTSPVASVNAYRFPDLSGSLKWTPEAFDVWDAGARFYGGTAKFSYSIKPLGRPERPTQRFDATYADVDLAQFTDFEQFRGLRFAGRASGHNLLEWPSGRFSEHRGGGSVTVAPPADTTLMASSLDAANAADRGHARHEWGPFAPMPLPAHLPIGGGLTYRFDAGRVDVEGGRFVTPHTHVEFGGTTAWGERSRFDFHVISDDLQESDEVLAGILTDFGSHSAPVPFGGRGEFDGQMTGPFRRPRVEGEFAGDDLRAWDTLWGAGSAHIAFENSYVDIKDAVVRLGGSEIRADGRFTTTYPRDDGGEEINARFRVARRDIVSLRHAFGLDDYPLSGLLSGEFHLTGQYQRPIGFGGMTVDEGITYGEPFEKATASLRFDGNGIRLDGINIAKAGGGVTGAAFVGWDGTYSFNADGRRIPVERLATMNYPRAPLSGMAAFSAGGSGTFEQPRYDVKFRVDDLFIADEGVGQVTASLALRGKELSGEIEAASPRLAITGTGRISLTPHEDAEITFRFHDSSLDPYVRLFVPRLSPYTTAVASGSIRIVGELADVDHLLVDGTIDRVDIRLFDYAVRNATPIKIALDRHSVRVDQLELVGEDTRLRVAGNISLHDQRIAMEASGDANLGILQGLFRDVRGSGRAALTAAIQGPLQAPVFSGSATITGGRIRHLSLPNALDEINGTIQFDASGIRLDDVTAKMGGGDVQFGGRIGFDGYLPGELNVTARGEDMRLRYPEGIRSAVDADLAVRGNFKAPTLGGTVTVKTATWSKRIDPTGGLLDFSGRRTAGAVVTAAPSSTLPLRLDVRVLVPSTLRIENNLARMVASADLTLRGTYDRPILSGRAEVDRGEVNFEGRRYLVTHGTIDFNNPQRIDPFFDVEAETRVRVPGQTYIVTVRATGTAERLQPKLDSDPPLPTRDVLALLFSGVRRSDPNAPGGLTNAELDRLRNPNQAQTDILTTRATQLLTNPISSTVGSAVEQTFGVDTFQLAPSFLDPYATQQTARINPSARVTIGKRISERAYLTYSRSLNTSINDQIILLEYDESDRFSWILSRNEDNTYAIEIRVRHTF